MGRHSGFSLVELLVVIAIIALLIAILLPALARVRRMGRSTVCIAHLQQINASYRMYLNANRNHSFPFQEDLTSLTWFELLQPYNGSMVQMMLCPEATVPGNLIGGAFTAWGPEWTYVKDNVPRGQYVGSYGANNWIFEPPAEQRPSIAKDYAERMIVQPARQAERVPVFADCIMPWAAPDSTDTAPYNLINVLPYYSGTGPRPPGPTGQLAYYCINRHFRAINVAFLDGHVERIDLEGLWKLRWNSVFKPRDIVLP